MKIIKGFCVECQRRGLTKRYTAYCQKCLNKAFDTYKNITVAKYRIMKMNNEF